MTWKLEKIAALELREFDGKQVMHVIGVVGTRHCGCFWVEGMRMDDQEKTFGIGACELHELQVNRAHETVLKMPPSFRVMHELYQEQLDFELEPWAQ